jgi:uncharacterized protein (DUF2141 family)
LKDFLDSAKIIPFKTTISKNQLVIDFDKSLSKQLGLTIKGGAIKTSSSQFSEEFKTTVKIASEKDYGAIEINTANFKEPIVVELIKDSKAIDKLILYESNKGSFTNLTPGEYQFRVIADENKNGKWDTGNLDKQIQPEKIYWFTTPTKVRANWEVEVVLSPKINE